jgi:hypothetical protein
MLADDIVMVLGNLHTKLELEIKEWFHSEELEAFIVADVVFYQGSECVARKNHYRTSSRLGGKDSNMSIMGFLEPHIEDKYCIGHI